jgi:hypothetical protein
MSAMLASILVVVALPAAKCVAQNTAEFPLIFSQTAAQTLADLWLHAVVTSTKDMFACVFGYVRPDTFAVAYVTPPETGPGPACLTLNDSAIRTIGLVTFVDGREYAGKTRIRIAEQILCDILRDHAEWYFVGTVYAFSPTRGQTPYLWGCYRRGIGDQPQPLRVE